MALTKYSPISAWALAVALAWPVAAPASGPDGLTLRIDNADTHDLRCIMVMAHFMSTELGTVAAGQGLNVEVHRNAANGALFVLSDDGRRQMIENVICGLSGDWSATRSDLALQDVRASSAAVARFLCHLSGRVRCVLTDDGG